MEMKAKAAKVMAMKANKKPQEVHMSAMKANKK